MSMQELVTMLFRKAHLQLQIDTHQIGFQISKIAKR